MIRLLKKTLVESSRLVYQNGKFAILFWITNLGFSIALTFPVFLMLYDNLHQSVLSSPRGGEFDFLWFMQFRELNIQMFQAIPGMLYSVTFLYNIIQLFYTGGLLAVSLNVRKNHIVDFFYGGVKYFFRFFVIFLLTLLFFFLALSVNTLIYSVIESAFSNSQNTELEYGLHAARYVVFLFLITVVNFVSDYAKIVTVVGDETNMFTIIVKAIRFIRANFTVVISLFLFLASCILGAAILYNLADGFIPKTSVFLIAATFSVQQLLILFRLFTRMLFYTSELFIFRELSAEVIAPQLSEVS